MGDIVQIISAVGFPIVAAVDVLILLNGNMSRTRSRLNRCELSIKKKLRI